MFDTILVPTDGSEGATAAAGHAVGIARQTGGTVHALYVVDVRMSPISSETSRDDALNLLEAADEDPTGPVRDRAERAGVPAVESIRVGVPNEAIREYADEYDVDLVVMGTHGRTGLEHALLGSVTERVIRTADAPVLSVPRNDQ